jgi:hypothetical protein
VATITVTEALAEIKTIGKRLNKKQEYVQTLLARDSRIVDPLLKQGGSVEAVRADLQSIGDLETRLIQLRTAIQKANHDLRLTVQGKERSIMEWLTWRKEVAPQRQRFVSQMLNRLAQTRKEAQGKGITVAAAVATVDTGASPVVQLLINLDEAALNKENEELEQILGDLDGQLSLKNATSLIEV